MIYFVSGHRNLSKEDFNRLYVPEIMAVLAYGTPDFVVGDYEGVDKMFMDFIMPFVCKGDCSLTIYHMFTSPRHTPFNRSVEELTSQFNITFIGGFQTDEERDAAMTADSDYDIAFYHWNRYKSGTARNIQRRHEFR